MLFLRSYIEDYHKQEQSNKSSIDSLNQFIKEQKMILNFEIVPNLPFNVYCRKLEMMSGVKYYSKGSRKT